LSFPEDSFLRIQTELLIQDLNLHDGGTSFIEIRHEDTICGVETHEPCGENQMRRNPGHMGSGVVWLPGLTDALIA
jgi:hypothetical protein